MGVHGNRRMAESGIKYNVRGLAPTPGSASNKALSSGTLLSCSSINMRQVLMTFAALVLKSPMVLMCSFRLRNPSV